MTTGRHVAVPLTQDVPTADSSEPDSRKVDRRPSVSRWHGSRISFRTLRRTRTEQFGDEPPQCQLSIMHTPQSGAIDSYCVASGCNRLARAAAVYTVDAGAIASIAVRQLPLSPC